MARRYSSLLTASVLEDLWLRQGGICMITGRLLQRDAQLDHIVPIARGGSHDISNLRWVCPEANLAKRDLLDEEYLELCRDSIEYIGRRIREVLP